MAELAKLIVIYNPFSGRRKVKQLPQMVVNLLADSIYDVLVWPTEKASDVTMLTERAIKEKATIVVAAGGDGTINQVAASLVNTGICLGIIPLGSGNGFARHFNIPLNTEKAILLLNKGLQKDIDTIWINRHCMVNVGGIGFDAHISSLFANNKKRGLQGYVKTIIKQLGYKSELYKIFQNQRLIWQGHAFMISIANATQWGNNVIVHAGALPDDGLLNLIVLEQFSAFELPRILANVLQGKLHLNKKTKVYTGTDFRIEREKDGSVHADGEPLWLGKEININIEPLSLKVLSNG
ncbi:MAG: diacylglycerol kinase family lipid kinase [bacterium]|nr:diacylglycerol kinase family lipid kinase [bacterium]